MSINFIATQHSIPYGIGIQMMNSIVNDIIAGNAENTVWFLEHDAVYTAGSTMQITTNHIEVVADSKAHIIPVVITDRGGKITFHGLGQRIIYMMMDLKKLYDTSTPDMKVFINDIHELLIDVLLEFGIRAFKDPQYPGVWVQANQRQNKIAAIGMKVRKWVCFHGVALNVNTDMRYFNAIIPCGINDQMRGVISMQRLLGHNVDMRLVDDVLKEKFISRFGI